MALFPKTGGYDRVEDEESANLSDSESCETLLKGIQKRERPRSRFVPQMSCNAAGSMTLGLCIVAIVLVTIKCTILYERRGSNAPRWRPAFSPFYDMMDIPIITKYAEHSPAPNTSDPGHIYRLDPSPEVDAAWTRIATASAIYPVSAGDIARAGKNPDYAVDAPESWNYPPGKTKMMGIEAFHLLHCLNALRKGLITTYDYYWGSHYGFAPPAVFARHLNHCVDMLRQHLMCHADLVPFTFDWRIGQTKPYADFGIQKTCIDFDYLLDWVEENKDPLAEERWKALEKPEGVLQKEAPLDLPQITNESVWSEDHTMVLETLAGFEGREYCLGTNYGVSGSHVGSKSTGCHVR